MRLSSQNKKCTSVYSKIYIYYVGSIGFQESLIIHFLAFKCEGFANDVVSKYIVVT